MKEINHSYKELQDTGVWSVIDETIAELEENNDLELTTAREYVIGYICKTLKERGMLTGESTRHAGP